MSDHEQRMRDARVYAASVKGADELATVPVERRAKYDVWAHLERLQASCDEEREALAEDRERNAAVQQAMLKFGRRVRVVYWLGALLATMMFVASFVLIQRNREAIEVSCLVVVRVVRDSGANSGQRRTTPVARAQARIVRALYRASFGTMSARERRRFLADQAIVRRAGGSIPEPQCAQIADNPDEVRREVLQTPMTR